MQNNANSNHARNAILNKISSHLGHDNRAQRSESAQKRLYENPNHLIPKIGLLKTKKQRIDRFTEQAEKVDANIYNIKKINDLPKLSANIMAQYNIDQKMQCAPHTLLKKLKWEKHITEFDYGSANEEDIFSLSVAYAGVSETGTLAFLTGAESPKSLIFLAQHHLVLLPTSKLYANYEQVFAAMRKDYDSTNRMMSDKMPRSLNFVTGPSRTADIEQTLTLGAHGPLSLHIILYDD